MHRPGTEALFTLLFVLLLLLGAEYYLLIESGTPDAIASYPVVAKVASVLLRLGTALRVSFLLCYTALSFWLVQSSPAGSPTKE